MNGRIFTQDKISIEPVGNDLTVSHDLKFGEIEVRREQDDMIEVRKDAGKQVREASKHPSAIDGYEWLKSGCC